VRIDSEQAFELKRMFEEGAAAGAGTHLQIFVKENKNEE